jgi:hypothetical protein
MSAALGGVIKAIICETAWGGPFHRALCDTGYTASRLDPASAVENILYVRT